MVRRFLFTLATVALMLPGIFAQTAPCGGHGDRNTMVVSTGWLAAHLKDPNLVILAVDQKQVYDAGHIPGAVFLDYMSTHTMAAPGEGLTVELPPMATLKDVLEKLGVSSNSHIILYSPTAGSLQITTRVFWTLDAMGLGARTSILDGGLALWRKENRAVSTDVPKVTPGKLELCPQRDVITDVTYVSANLHKPGVDIIDARAAQYYTGATIPNGQRAGHIPGASNLTYSSLVDSDGKWKAPDELRQMFTGAGVKAGDQVVSYCHIGQQATVVYFAARYLGFDARMYDGSWQDWSAHSELPVESSTDKK